MFALSDARDYSFWKVPYLEREEEITDQSNFVKNLIILAIECKMYLKIQQKLHCLGCISKQTMRSVVKKTRLNSSKDDFLMKSFPSSTKRKLSILLNFLFPFFVFNGVFLTLKCRTLALKHLHGDRPAAILLKMDICH